MIYSQNIKINDNLIKNCLLLVLMINIKLVEINQKN